MNILLTILIIYVILKLLFTETGLAILAGVLIGISL